MAIQEYVVIDDFFQCNEDDIVGIDFPCCCCKHNENDVDDEPCKFCGHNVNAVEHYCCVLCGSMIEGSPDKDSNYLATSTKSQVGPVCDSCRCNILRDICSDCSNLPPICDACGKPIVDPGDNVGIECDLHTNCISR